MMKRNKQVNVKETKKENLERCQKNMASLKLIGKWIQARKKLTAITYRTDRLSRRRI